MRAPVTAVVAALVWCIGSGASATDLCGGKPPGPGVVFRGPVLHVLDGQTLCVATGARPSEWTPVRLEDAPRSGRRATLMAVAFAKDVDCAFTGTSGGHCVLNGRSVGSLAAEPSAAKAGLDWREARDP